MNIHIVVINGKNHKTYVKVQKYIEKNKISNITNLGFVINIAEYYKACDVCITKCGSGVTSELLTINKPFITREKMIINEKINQQFYYNNGCALIMKKINDAGENIEQIMQPELYKNMVEKTKELARPNAAKDIVEFLINQ